MKAKLFLTFIALVFTSHVFGQSNSTKRIAILETVDKEGKIPYGVKLMVRSKLCAVIAATPGYEGYDRIDVSSILGEHEFQRTGLVSDKEIKRLGEMAGADYILVAEAAYLSSSYIFLSAKILSVETARVEQTADIETTTTVDGLNNNCRLLAGKLLNVNSETGAVRGELTIDGDKYVGEHKDGKPHGRGTMFYDDSNLKTYEGDWVYGKREGKGTLIWTDGERYVGDWKNDHLEGYGTCYYSDGELYEGNWLNGKRHGKGKITFAQDDSLDRKYYDGNWVGDVRQGEGVMVWNDGDCYKGNWVNGFREGNGTFQYASGNKYVGMYLEGKMHGQGTFYWRNGDYETATYVNDVKNGEFTYYFADGRKRVGRHLNGKKEGYATYYFVSGGYCKEHWVNGKLEGKKYYYDKYGKMYKMKAYKNGVCVKTKIY